MNKTKLLALTGGLLAVMAFAGPATAREYSIKPYQNYIDGKSTIHLKHELIRQHGPRKFHNSRLNYVDVYGKGRAKIRLYIDGDGRDTERLRSNRYETDHIRLSNNSDADGDWTLGVHGEVKIHRIVADVSHKRRYDGYRNGKRYGDKWPWNHDRYYDRDNYRDNDHGYSYRPGYFPWQYENSYRRDGWQLQQYCNCQTGKRCYTRHRNGHREVGRCIYQCPNGCKNPASY